MTSRRLAKISLALAILAMVVGGIGFIVLPILNAFVLDKYNAYGEVPIPGSASLHLPAGKVTVSFHTEVISGPNGGPMLAALVERSQDRARLQRRRCFQ